MNRSDLSEIKKYYKIDKTNLVRIAGCYVNGEKEKVCTFVSRYGTLDDNEQFKYLEILNKTLSGKLGDQLMELSFPYEEETDGEHYRSLLALRNTELENEELLSAFYDQMIDTVEITGNFLILLFYDVRDIMNRNLDGLKDGESEETFRYIVCSVCPVELAEPGLSYIAEANTIGARMRDWVVKKPETGFMFPTLTDRSQDVHNVLFYSKDARAPHREIAEKILGCTEKSTVSEQKSYIKELVSKEVGFDHKDVIDEVLSDFHYALSEQDAENAENYGEDTHLELSREVLEKALKSTDISLTQASSIAAKLDNAFAGDEVYADALADSTLVKKGQNRAEKKELLEKIDFLEAVSEDRESYRIVKVSRDFELIPMEVNGVLCYVIPEAEAEVE